MKTQRNYTVYTVRDRKVILDFEAAAMLEVTNRRLRANVKANSPLFPQDSMMILSDHEWNRIKSMYGVQFGSRNYRPYAFTQVGLLLLAGLLRQSARAFEISIFAARMYAALQTYQAQIPATIQRVERNSNLKYLDAYNALTELGK